MGIREGVNNRWYADCDTNEERVFVSCCYVFQKPPRSEPDREALRQSIQTEGWQIAFTADRQEIVICPGCTPKSVREMDQETRRAYLVGLTRPLTQRELLRRLRR